MIYLKKLFWNEETQEQKQARNQKYILLTYRSKIKKADPSTYYSSDSGWGCMLRVGQMLLANIFLKQQDVPQQQILNLTFDNQLMPLSIQSFTKISQELYPEKKKYQWYTPNQCGLIIKRLFDKLNPNYRVTISNGNSLFLEKIQIDGPKILLLVVCRIGLDKPQKQYLECVKKLTNNPYFFSILGGTPKRAHLFMKHIGEHFGYLDPHKTQKAQKNLEELSQHAEQYISKLSWIKQTKLDTSMSLCFIFKKQQINNFLEFNDFIKIVTRTVIFYIPLIKVAAIQQLIRYITVLSK